LVDVYPPELYLDNSTKEYIINIENKGIKIDQLTVEWGYATGERKCIESEDIQISSHPDCDLDFNEGEIIIKLISREELIKSNSSIIYVTANSGRNKCTDFIKIISDGAG